MSPRARSTSIDSVVREAMQDVVRKASEDIARAIAELAAAELTKRLEAGVARPVRAGRAGVARPVRAGRAGAARRPPRREMSRWIADRRARRVPNFVIALTGLKTKKQIVARYGADAAFEKGKPAPKPKA